MGHRVTGLIAETKSLADFASTHGLHAPVPLQRGLALLALRPDDIDAFLAPPLTGHALGFTYLSEQLVKELLVLSAHAPVMYFETDYFGGAGGQGSAVFAGGKAVYGPVWAASGAINAALAHWGIRSDAGAPDAFDAIGLGRHRTTDGWVQD